mgnify:FL=1
MTQNCIFCTLGSQADSNSTLYCDDSIYAIKDINPRSPTHILVIHLMHISDLGTTHIGSGKLLGHILHVAAKLADSQGIADSGYRLVINQGYDAGQEIEHLHVHVIGGRTLGSMG